MRRCATSPYVPPSHGARRSSREVPRDRRRSTLEKPNNVRISASCNELLPASLSPTTSVSVGEKENSPDRPRKPRTSRRSTHTQNVLPSFDGPQAGFERQFDPTPLHLAAGRV